jgi:hypothetical protein
MVVHLEAAHESSSLSGAEYSFQLEEFEGERTLDRVFLTRLQRRALHRCLAFSRDLACIRLPLRRQYQLRFAIRVSE